MKKTLLALTVFSVLFFGCKKSTNAEEQAAIDDTKIQAYIAANNLTMTKDVSGLYYQIITEGSGTAPTTASHVRVAYTGTLLDGTAVDSSTNFSTLLSSTIQGWQIGLPLIKPGGRILLIIPSALGYGTTKTGSIPENSVLVFTIDLFKVQG